jgi:hypothetical protein
MPSSNPEVNGTDNRPASSRVRSRTSGSLSGEFQCACPLSSSRREVVSSMIPIDADTGLSVAISVHDITPGLRCGNSPVASITWIATARR